MKISLSLMATLLMLSSCSNDAEFASGSYRSRMVDDSNQEQMNKPSSNATPDSTRTPENEVEIIPDEKENPDWEVDLDGDSKSLFLTLRPENNAPVDYLFVIDNSTSMGGSNGMHAQLERGFKEMIQNGNFPANSKIGIISTAVNEVSNDGAKKEGFKAVVSKNSIATSSRSNSSIGANPGCNGWFAPTEKDKKNNYCLVSHIKFKLYGTSIEAGLSSFDNYLNAQKNLAFRKDSLVNIVFFSDTHDLGIGNYNKHPSLAKRLKEYSYAGFVKKVKDNAKVKSLKFHGMIPLKGMANCGENQHGDYAYSKFINASGGKQVHCKGAVYSDFISDMVENSKSATKVMKLPDNFNGEIDYIEVDGNRQDFVHDKANNTIIIKNIDIREEARVQVFLK